MWGSVLKSYYNTIIIIYHTLYYIFLKDVKADNSEEDSNSVEQHVCAGADPDYPIGGHKFFIQWDVFRVDKRGHEAPKN